MAAALSLTLLGIFRFLSDVLTDASPEWYHWLEGTFLRYLIRAPSDGTFWGDLSVQWFKVLSVPCAVSGLFLFFRVTSVNLNHAQERWDQKNVRLMFLISFLAAFTVMEVEKATHFMGLRMAGLLPGERAWVNHLLHAVSGLIGWHTMKWLRFIKPG